MLPIFFPSFPPSFFPDHLVIPRSRSCILPHPLSFHWVDHLLPDPSVPLHDDVPFRTHLFPPFFLFPSPTTLTQNSTSAFASAALYSSLLETLSPDRNYHPAKDDESDVCSVITPIHHRPNPSTRFIKTEARTTAFVFDLFDLGSPHPVLHHTSHAPAFPIFSTSPRFQSSSSITMEYRHRPAPLKLETYEHERSQQQYQTHDDNPALSTIEQSARKSSVSQPMPIQRPYPITSQPHGSSGYEPRSDTIPNGFGFSYQSLHSSSSQQTDSASSSEATVHAQPYGYPYTSSALTTSTMAQPFASNQPHSAGPWDGPDASYRHSLIHGQTTPNPSYSFQRSNPYFKSPEMGSYSRSSGDIGTLPTRLSYGSYSTAQRDALQDRPYKCDECVQSFNRNHDLKRHKRIHLAIKPFACDKCGKQFSRKDALRRHWLVKGCRGDESQANMANPLYAGAGHPPALSPSTPETPYPTLSNHTGSSSSQPLLLASPHHRLMIRTPSLSGGPMVVTPDEEHYDPLHTGTSASTNNNSASYPYTGFPSSAPAPNSSFQLIPNIPSLSTTSASSTSLQSHSNLLSPHINVAYQNMYSIPSSAPPTDSGFATHNWNAASDQARYGMSTRPQPVSTSTSSSLTFALDRSGSFNSGTIKNGGGGGDSSGGLSAQSVLVVQSDELVDSDMDDNHGGPQDQGRLRRGSQSDYFDGVFTPSHPGYSKYSEMSPTVNNGPTGSQPVFSIPFKQSVDVVRSASQSSSDGGLNMDGSLHLPSDVNSQQWQRW